MYRWARLLKQQSLITVNHFSSKENQLPFAAKKWKFAVSFCCKQTEVTVFRLRNSGNMETCIGGHR
jgi:hypothetical protein